MGRGKKLKETQQPHHIRESGVPRDDGVTESGPGSDDSGTEVGPPEIQVPEELSVELVHLDRDRVQVVQIGDRVKVNVQRSSISIHVRQGRLGDIPPDYDGTVRVGGFDHGFVSEVIQSRPLVRVTLRS